MGRPDTYHLKYSNLKKQYKLYDDYLNDPDTHLSFDQRSKLIYEMGKMLSFMKMIENMTYQKTKQVNDDYTIVKNSIINPVEHIGT